MSFSKTRYGNDFGFKYVTGTATLLIRSGAAMSMHELLASLNFVPISLLGEGSFGKVFHGTDASGTNLAVKICNEPAACLAAASEAAVMSAMPVHPNVMPVTSFEELPTATVLAMPLATTGGDTLKYMQERACTPLAEIEVYALFEQLVSAVEHMHCHGVVHRDIKCENVLLSGCNRRTVILADFGFATRFQKGKCALSDAYGSLHYSSPEICEERNYEGPEVDIWSMGVVLYAWASGRLPFGGATSDEIITRIITGNFTMHRNLSTELCDLIKRMLEVDPTKRATITDIKSSAWFTTSARRAAATTLVPMSTSSRQLSRLIEPEQPRRRNSDADPKRPSALTRVLRSVFGRK